MKTIKSILVMVVILFTTAIFIHNHQATAIRKTDTIAAFSIRLEKITKIDSLMKQCYLNNQFNGNVLVAEKGKVIYQNTFGIANLSPREPLTLDHQFNLASVSKQFTAMAIMILSERHQLDYNDDIQKYLPELPYKGMTIAHLLNHTSGIPVHEHLFAQYWDIDKEDQDKKVADNNDLLALIVERHPPVLFKPGEKWDYSNTGYDLLALIVSRIAGVSFESFMENNVFRHLGMSNTLVFNEKHKKVMEHRAYGFHFDLNGFDAILDDYHYLNGIVGDGAVYSTIGDLLKWDRALYTDKLVSKQTLERAFTPAILNDNSATDYGFGWHINTTTEGKRIVSHGGGWVGFRTIISREIDDDITIVLVSNNTTPHTRAIAKAIQDILHDRPFVYPKIKISQIIGKIVVTEGIDKAISQYHNLKTSKADEYDFNETDLNAVGYRLLRMDKITDAIEIFRLNVLSYPESANVFDSLGEAYLKNGQRDLAIQNYEKSLELDSTNENAKKMLKELRAK